MWIDQANRYIVWFNAFVGYFFLFSHWLIIQSLKRFLSLEFLCFKFWTYCIFSKGGGGNICVMFCENMYLINSLSFVTCLKTDTVINTSMSRTSFRTFVRYMNINSLFKILLYCYVFGPVLQKLLEMLYRNYFFILTQPPLGNINDSVVCIFVIQPEFKYPRAFIIMTPASYMVGLKLFIVMRRT